MGGVLVGGKDGIGVTSKCEGVDGRKVIVHLAGKLMEAG